MRVLFWAGTFWPVLGGVEVLAAKLLPALRERGCEFIVITSKREPGEPDVERYEGIPIHRLPFWIPQNYTDIERLMEMRRRVAALKRSFQPDLVHVNAVGLGDFFYHTTANVQPTPLLVSLHGTWGYLNGGVDSLAARTLRAADWVVGCSAAILEKGRRLVPEITRRSSVIHNALAVPALAADSLPLAEPRLLCLGRLVDGKGIDLAIAAFKLILTRFPRARLVIGGDGPARFALERQVAELGIRDVVEFIGQVPRDRVPFLLNTATLVLIPSREEAFNLVALEAAFLARPVVATRVGGLPEVVADGETGLLVEPENVAGLTAAVQFFLDHPQIAVKMGQVGRRRAKRLFNWDTYVTAHDSLYRELIAKRRAPTDPTSPLPEAI